MKMSDCKSSGDVVGGKDEDVNAASTNALGVFLFIACLAIPWWRNYSNTSLAIALLLGLLSFYAKQYFILCMAILCLYLFLYVSMRRALLLGTCFATALLASL